MRPTGMDEREVWLREKEKSVKRATKIQVESLLGIPIFERYDDSCRTDANHFRQQYV